MYTGIDSRIVHSDDSWKAAGSNVVHLTDDNFEEFISKHDSVMVAFYAPWCPHCKSLKSEYEEAAKVINRNQPILAAVDSAEYTELTKKYQVVQYPTLKYFGYGNFAWDIEEKTKEKLVEFMSNPVDPTPEPTGSDPTKISWYSSENPVTIVNMLEIKEKLVKIDHALVMFYVDSCQHCEDAKPQFMEAAAVFANMADVMGFLALNCGGHLALDFCHKEYKAKWVPTFIYFRKGKKVQRFYYPPMAQEFINYMSDAPNKMDFEEFWQWQEPIKSLDDDTAEETLSKYKRSFVFYYTPYDVDCQEIKQTFSRAAEANKNKDVLFAAIDCLEYQPFCNKRDPPAKGFPQFRIYQGKKLKSVYEGQNTKDGFLDAVSLKTEKEL